jgi:hypothetical protein
MKRIVTLVLMLVGTSAFAQVTKLNCTTGPATVEVCRYSDNTSGVSFYGLSTLQAAPALAVATCESIGPCAKGQHCESGAGGAVCVQDTVATTPTCAIVSCPSGFQCISIETTLACVPSPCPNAWEIRNTTGECIAIPCPNAGEVRDAAGVCAVSAPPPPPPPAISSFGESHDNIAPVAGCDLPFWPGAPSWTDIPASSWTSAGPGFASQTETSLRAYVSALSREGLQLYDPPRACGWERSVNLGVLSDPNTWLPEMDRHVAYGLRLLGLCAGAMGEGREFVYVRRADGLYEAWSVFDPATGCITTQPMLGVYQRV